MNSALRSTLDSVASLEQKRPAESSRSSRVRVGRETKAPRESLTGATVHRSHLPTNELRQTWSDPPSAIPSSISLSLPRDPVCCHVNLQPIGTADRVRELAQSAAWRSPESAGEDAGRLASANIKEEHSRLPPVMWMSSWTGEPAGPMHIETAVAPTDHSAARYSGEQRGSTFPIDERHLWPSAANGPSIPTLGPNGMAALQIAPATAV